jgi:hypothetical protein
MVAQNPKPDLAADLRREVLPNEVSYSCAITATVLGISWESCRVRRSWDDPGT